MLLVKQFIEELPTGGKIARRFGEDYRLDIFDIGLNGRCRRLPMLTKSS